MFGAAGDVRTLALRGLKDVKWDAFAQKTRLRSVRVGNGPKTLGTLQRYCNGRLEPMTGVFTESGVEQVELPNTLRLLGASAFEKCARLRQIALPEGLETVCARCFRECPLELVEIPRSVVIIGDEAFFGCRALKSVVFREGSQLESIGELAFSQTGIGGFLAPKSLKTIGQGAFAACSSL